MLKESLNLVLSSITRSDRIFKKHEQCALNERAELRSRKDENSYAAKAREHILELEEPIREDDRDLKADADHA